MHCSICGDTSSLEALFVCGSCEKFVATCDCCTEIINRHRELSENLLEMVKLFLETHGGHAGVLYNGEPHVARKAAVGV